MSHAQATFTAHHERLGRGAWVPMAGWGSHVSRPLIDELLQADRHAPPGHRPGPAGGRARAAYSSTRPSTRPARSTGDPAHRLRPVAARADPDPGDLHLEPRHPAGPHRPERRQVGDETSTSSGPPPGPIGAGHGVPPRDRPRRGRDLLPRLPLAALGPPRQTFADKLLGTVVAQPGRATSRWAQRALA